MSMMWVALVIALGMLVVYVAYPARCRSTASKEEAVMPQPGDHLVSASRGGYTLAMSIDALPSKIWPWLVQMGQGRAGFYTHEWVENLLRADIHNANGIHPALQNLAVGDLIRLTPDPYLGRLPGQSLVVAEMSPERALTLRQDLPNDAVGSWAFALQDRPNGRTRLLFRRRTTRLSLLDRVLLPGYYFMDIGMLAGIKKRVEGVIQENGGSRRRTVKRFELGVRAMRGEAHPMAIRYSLGSLLAFGALNAIGGGYYGLSGAAGVPTAWLEGSPFSDYFIPSLILLVVVGGSFLTAAILVFAGMHIARVAALTAGLVVLGWLAAQVAIIGYVSWMQPTTATAGVLVLILARLLPTPREPLAHLNSADSGK